ncbi:MAG: phenylpyruvate tautomerase MIF-related protein, partial [Gammaproteobacteria bacterium]|nr:phenylpyruvate tautomerase MIF-related protein [Gammaproteobacteria bacterium]
MPYLMIQTNQSLDANASKSLLAEASKLVAAELGKPENYVMVALEADVPMLFAGSNAPLAYLELKSIGLPESKTTALSAALCGLIENATGISQDRIYIEF